MVRAEEMFALRDDLKLYGPDDARERKKPVIPTSGGAPFMAPDSSLGEWESPATFGDPSGAMMPPRLIPGPVSGLPGRDEAGAIMHMNERNRQPLLFLWRGRIYAAPRDKSGGINAAPPEEK